MFAHRGVNHTPPHPLQQTPLNESTQRSNSNDRMKIVPAEPMCIIETNRGSKSSDADTHALRDAAAAIFDGLDEFQICQPRKNSTPLTADYLLIFRLQLRRQLHPVANVQQKTDPLSLILSYKQTVSRIAKVDASGMDNIASTWRHKNRVFRRLRQQDAARALTRIPDRCPQHPC